MYINTTKDTLLKSVRTAAKAVPSKASNPIMENLLFGVVPGGFCVNATDGEIIITTFSRAEEASGERTCISAKTIVELVSVLPEGDVTIETNDKSAKVTWASGHSEIPVANAADFPDIAQPCLTGCALNAKEVCTAISHTLPHVATDILRPQLTGIHFNPHDGITDVVGTDSHTVCVYPIQGGVDRPFTISAKVAAIVRDAAADADTISVFISDSRIAFQSGDVVVSAVGIIGKFPDYNRVIPADNGNILTADLKSLVQQIRRVAICSNKTSNHIRLDLNALSSTVSAQDLGFGTSAQETLAVDYSGDDLAIGFKHDFLLKSIGVFDGDTVQIKFSDPRKAALVTSDGDPAKCVVMPVAIQ